MRRKRICKFCIESSNFQINRRSVNLNCQLQREKYNSRNVASKFGLRRRKKVRVIPFEWHSNISGLIKFACVLNPRLGIEFVEWLYLIVGASLVDSRAAWLRQVRFWSRRFRQNRWVFLTFLRNFALRAFSHEFKNQQEKMGNWKLKKLRFLLD